MMNCNNKKINILITTSTFPIWENDCGLAIVSEIAKNLKKHYHSLNLFILAPHYNGVKQYEDNKYFQIFRFKYFFTKYEKLCYKDGILKNIKKNKFLYLLIPFFICSQIWNIKKLIKKYEIDIIHAHWLIPQGLSAVLYKKLFNKNIKIICTAHGSDIFCLKNGIVNFVKKYILKNIDLISAVSDALKNKIIQSSISQINATTIHNGIDLSIFKPIQKNTNLSDKHSINSHCLLYVGRLNEIKGVKYLINAMQSIVPIYPDIRILIIGDGEDLQKLKHQTNNLGLQNNIKFLGNIQNKNLPEYYNLADIFIGPSIKEGLGMVFLEALACGTPVIATNTGGIPDVIIPNQTGILVSPKNSEEISIAILHLLKNKNKQATLSQNGKKFVEKNFNWEKISAQYYNLYNKLTIRR